MYCYPVKIRASVPCFLCIGLVLTLVAGCATYGHRVAPIPLPQSQAGHVEVDRVTLTARAYLDPKLAEKRFSFDIRNAGLLPIQVVIDNQSGTDVNIVPSQTFLIDTQQQAWPLLSAQEAYNRVKGKVELGETARGTAKPAVLLGAAGALVGFAIGVVSGRDIGEDIAKGAVIGATAGALAGGAKGYASVSEKIHDDLARRTLRNKPIGPGQLAHGFLFFPGKDEAGSATILRLALRIGGEERVVNIPVLPGK